ncbi:MAG: hypothetical protein A2751_03405 [Candidatus Doudnabacteria bacterium RIFCSPHIGHO2_01_FULL_46_14]|uniref:Type II secretion system protein J n=1 Tax=Candidatus Doudnabacteria bacterium RIFCSPHIGHO2_01_FULL_46_14 TaxID=1817824 RepID=A0A1F5NKF1_9BACT|nr:MAG: hypothetical protein A2751_03405 [Candidatus Doudnabacteria bacterium RIFCSPHIGHO2_01_FULL_46_14]
MKKAFKFAAGFTTAPQRSLLRGFTLIEMIITIFIFSVIALGMIILISNMVTNSSRQSRLLAGSDQARKTAFQITNELRNATSGATGAYSLGITEAQQLLFYSNVDQAADIERVRYYTQNAKLYRGIVKPTGTPPVYNTGSEVSSVVIEDLANGTNPIFYYYNDTYDGTFDNYLTQPVSIPQVRYIKSNLQIYLTGGIANSQTYTVTSSAAIRNLKTNLGN